MATKKKHLRVANPGESLRQPNEFKKHIIFAAGGAVAGAAAVMLFNGVIKHGKKILNPKKEETPPPVAGFPWAMNTPYGMMQQAQQMQGQQMSQGQPTPQAQALMPGAQSPNPNPQHPQYPGMPAGMVPGLTPGMTPGFGYPGMSVQPEAGSVDGPPKWFQEFQATYEKRTQAMEARMDLATAAITKDMAARLRPVDDEDAA